MSQPTPARRAAYEVLRRTFEHGAWADRVIDSAARRAGADGRERAQAQHLAYGAVRRRGTSDHLAEALAGRPAGRLDPAVIAALRLGFFELLYSAGSVPYAAVDQAVALVRAAGAGRASGLVNAVLRRAARERDELLAGLGDETPERAAVCHSVPVWIARLWWRELGPESARSLLAAVNEPAETALRVNGLLCEDADAAILALSRDGLTAASPPGIGPLALPEALVLEGGGDLRASAARRQGMVVPQARAAMAVTAILDPRPGERVLDLCAAPGGKTTHLAARVGARGKVVAVDVSEARCRELSENVARLGADGIVEVRHADAGRDDLGDGYDRVLVDPPCSDLGTLASRPDVRWRKDPEDVERLAGIQERVLGAAVRAVRPGGRIAYSTCTLTRRESSGVLDRALATHGELQAEEAASVHPAIGDPEDPRLVITRPDRDRTDGFAIATLRRRDAVG